MLAPELDPERNGYHRRPPGELVELPLRLFRLWPWYRRPRIVWAALATALGVVSAAIIGPALAGYRPARALLVFQWLALVALNVLVLGRRPCAVCGRWARHTLVCARCRPRRERSYAHRGQ